MIGDPSPNDIFAAPFACRSSLPPCPCGHTRLAVCSYQWMQEGSLVSPLLTGEEQTRAAQVSETAYAFSHCWSNIPVHDQQSILEALRKKYYPMEHLSKNGYCIRPLTAAEVDGARKCNNC